MRLAFYMVIPPSGDASWSSSLFLGC